MVTMVIAQLYLYDIVLCSLAIAMINSHIIIVYLVVAGGIFIAHAP